MSVGGWLADRLARTNPRALFIVPGLAMLASIPFVAAGAVLTVRACRDLRRRSSWPRP